MKVRELIKWLSLYGTELEVIVTSEAGETENVSHVSVEQDHSTEEIFVRIMTEQEK